MLRAFHKKAEKITGKKWNNKSSDETSTRTMTTTVIKQEDPPDPFQHTHMPAIGEVVVCVCVVGSDIT